MTFSEREMLWWCAGLTNSDLPCPPDAVQAVIDDMRSNEWSEVQECIKAIRTSLMSGVDLVHAVSMVVYLGSKVSDGMMKSSRMSTRNEDVDVSSAMFDLGSEDGTMPSGIFVSPFISKNNGIQRTCSVNVYLSGILCLSISEVQQVKETVKTISNCTIPVFVGKALEDVWKLERTTTKLYVMAKEELKGYKVIWVEKPYCKKRYKISKRADSQPPNMLFESMRSEDFQFDGSPLMLSTSTPIAIVTTMDAVEHIKTEQLRSVTLVYSDLAGVAELAEQVVLLCEVKSPPEPERQNNFKCISGLMEIARNVKQSVLSPSSSHNGSTGAYFSEGSRNVTLVDEEGCSFCDYATRNDGGIDATNYNRFAKDQILKYFGNGCDVGIIAKNSAINQHHKLYNGLFGNLKLANEMLTPEGPEDTSPTYRCFDRIGMFPSYCFNQDAATAQYHTEEDTSYTLIYVAKVTGDVNLSFKINDNLEIHVPYSNNITLMYCASLLTHKQVIRKGGSGSSVINFSAYGKKKLEENAFVSLQRRASLTVTRIMSKKVGSFICE